MCNEIQFAEDLAAFLAHLRNERGYSAHTVDAYELNLYAVCRQLAAGTIADYLNPNFEELEAVIAAFRSGGGKNGQGRSPATVRQFIASLRSFYRWLLVTERLPSQAIDAVEVLSPPRVPKKVLPSLTVGQVRTLMQSISPRQRTGARDKAILEVLYSSGCRARELIGLLLADLDLSKGLIRCVGKGGKERMLHLGEDAATVLKAYLAFERPFFVRKTGDVPWLFVGQRGDSLGYSTLLHIVVKRSVAAGLPAWVRPHTLRRSCALHLLNGSANVRMVQGLLGHASLNTTQQYIEQDEARLQQVHSACHPHGDARSLGDAEPTVTTEPARLPADLTFTISTQEDARCSD